jgi:hypothetical protein
MPPLHRGSWIVVDTLKALGVLTTHACLDTRPCWFSPERTEQYIVRHFADAGVGRRGNGPASRPTTYTGMPRPCSDAPWLQEPVAATPAPCIDVETSASAGPAGASGNPPKAKPHNNTVAPTGDHDTHRVEWHDKENKFICSVCQRGTTRGNRNKFLKSRCYGAGSGNSRLAAILNGQAARAAEKLKQASSTLAASSALPVHAAAASSSTSASLQTCSAPRKRLVGKSPATARFGAVPSVAPLFLDVDARVASSLVDARISDNATALAQGRHLLEPLGLRYRCVSCSKSCTKSHRARFARETCSAARASLASPSAPPAHGVADDSAVTAPVRAVDALTAAPSAPAAHGAAALSASARSASTRATVSAVGSAVVALTAPPSVLSTVGIAARSASARSATTRAAVSAVGSAVVALAPFALTAPSSASRAHGVAARSASVRRTSVRAASSAAGSAGGSRA